MAKDNRYRTVKILIESKEITTFRQIFDHIPKTVVKRDFGISTQRMDNIIASPDDLRLREFKVLSNFFEIDVMILIQLANAQSGTKKPRKKL